MAREFSITLAVIDHALGHRGLRPVGRLEIAVDIEAGTGGDELADDDVLLQADQMVYLALDSGFGQNLRRLLEGGCGEEGLRGKGSLRDTHEDEGIRGQTDFALVALMRACTTALASSNS